MLSVLRELIPEVWRAVPKEGTGGKHEDERMHFLRIQVLREVTMAATVWHAVKAVKRLLEWGWKHERIEALPRNLDDYARVERPKPSPKFFTVEEVKNLYAQASPRTKLYILLALNGGFTQVDIATLTHEMIDWKTGIIVRDFLSESEFPVGAGMNRGQDSK